MDEQLDHIRNNLGQRQHQVNNNKEKTEEIQRRELINIREEFEVLRNRPMSYTHIPVSYTHLDVYKRQPQYCGH